MHNSQQDKLASENLTIIEQLQYYLQSLIDIAIYEESSLDRGDITELLSILPTKINIIRQLELTARQFNKIPVATISEDNKATISSLYKSLHSLLLTNQIKFKIAKDINFTIIQIILDNVVRSKQQTHNYNASGDIFIPTLEQKYVLPLTLNKKI